MKRVVLFRNGTEVDGKVVLLTHSISELLNTASGKFCMTAKRVFTKQGGEVDDVRLIRDDDVLYVSAGESFIDLKCSDCTAKCKLAAPTSSSSREWLTLNVGGKCFATTRSTLLNKEPDSMLARMFADESGSHIWPSLVDRDGAYLIDRSPRYFEPILDFLRHGKLILRDIDPEGVLEEAKFFGIESIIAPLEDMCHVNENKLTRKDVVRALIMTSHGAELRFQGVNLMGADLSRLDLRNINFKYANLQRANLRGSNLAFCCLERADVSNANLEGAILLGVKMLCANLEGANLKSCNFEDPGGTKANMEGVNLKGAHLEDSQMAGVNLRVATLKNANLQNCDLRGAVLAGADLENCDLSGSDLHEANLRGANLKDTGFEFMLTPLHMAQTVR